MLRLAAANSIFQRYPRIPKFRNQYCFHGVYPKHPQTKTGKPHVESYCKRHTHHSEPPPLSSPNQSKVGSALQGTFCHNTCRCFPQAKKVLEGCPPLCTPKELCNEK